MYCNQTKIFNDIQINIIKNNLQDFMLKNHIKSEEIAIIKFINMYAKKLRIVYCYECKILNKKNCDICNYF